MSGFRYFFNAETNIHQEQILIQEIEKCNITVHEILEDLPNFTASSCICVANSLVGDSTNTVGPICELLRERLRCIKPGIKYPNVFPDPVLAIATISRP